MHCLFDLMLRLIIYRPTYTESKLILNEKRGVVAFLKILLQHGHGSSQKLRASDLQGRDNENAIGSKCL